jgi:hypothetical protein
MLRLRDGRARREEWGHQKLAAAGRPGGCDDGRIHEILPATPPGPPPQARAAAVGDVHDVLLSATILCRINTPPNNLLHVRSTSLSHPTCSLVKL